MKVDVLLGLQWGDEGKGKVVDVLTPKYDVVARFQGGPNAGHTLEFEGQKYVLRSIPSGIFQGNKVNIIGNGVVLDPALFKAEAEALEASGHPLKERLHISKKAHLILPTHRILDAAYEAAKGDAKVGTTGKGIGPTYTDKVSRNGVRVGDILHNFDQKYAAAKARHEQILKSLNYEYDLTELEKAWLEGIEYLKQFHFVDSEHEVNNLLKDGKSVLCEGAHSSRPGALKLVICPHGINTPTNICSTTSCFRLMPHFSTAKPLPLYSESGPSCSSCSASAKSNGSLPISIKVAKAQAHSARISGMLRSAGQW